MPSVWRLLTVPTAADTAFAKQLDQRDWFATLLRLRGINSVAEAEAFLQPSLEMLPDPFLLPDMEAAVQRLIYALQNNETIAVYGDYDADGVTATALLVRGLRELGFAPPLTYIPDRFDEGYGLNLEALQYLQDMGAELVLTVDCGISSLQEAEFLHQQGIDLIITDHHQPGSELPKALAAVNPQRIPCSYSTPHLAGVGVAYEVIRALSQRLCRSDALRELTALVAIGTLADLMELDSVNRILVRDGLKALARCTHPGLRALLDQVPVNGEPSATQITFGIAPKINASGRMQHADLALDLLLCEDYEEAARLAKELDQLNELRKRTEQEVYHEALAQYSAADTVAQSRMVQVFHAAHWHPGVLGIVAAKLVDKLKRPVLVACSDDQGDIKGSGRVPEGYNLYAMLTGAEDLLIRYGGHVQAAGFSCVAENLPLLQQRLCTRLNLQEAYIEEIRADLEMPPTNDWHGIHRALRKLEPFGSGNEEPVWLLRGAQVQQVRLMGQGEHLSAAIGYAGSSVELVAWRKAASMSAFKGMVDLMVRLVRNTYRGQDTVRLELVDWRPTLVDHLEAVQKIRNLPNDAIVHYSMSESYVALLESGRVDEEIPPPRYQRSEQLSLPQTQSVLLGSGSGPDYLLDPLFETTVVPMTELVSPLQRRSWRQMLTWLLPDVVQLRQYYRWLRGFGDCALSKIPWESMPGGLKGEHATEALHNVLTIFSEAGFCDVEDKDGERMIHFRTNPSTVRMETMPSYQRLYHHREKLLRRDSRV